MSDEIQKIVAELTGEPEPTESVNGWDAFDNSSPDLLYCEDTGETTECVVRMHGTLDQLMRIGVDKISTAPGIGGVHVEVGHMIDHTLLKADATTDQVVQLCMEAKQYTFASVCINPYFVPLAASILHGTEVRVCTVVGFPLGCTPKEVKALEAKWAVDHGAREIDMVVNVSALKSDKLVEVEADIRAVREAIPRDVILKVIIETCYLNETQKVQACLAARNAGADYVKTSTGFGSGGATEADIQLMRRTVGSRMGVKASGGIRDRETAISMVKAGATRIGASASVKIVSGESGGDGY